MTESDPRSESEILAELRLRGEEVHLAEERLYFERLQLTEVLHEGSERYLMISRMARAARVSRQTAHKLIRQARRDAAERELSDRIDYLRDLGKQGRSDAEEVEYWQLLDRFLSEGT